MWSVRMIDVRKTLSRRQNILNGIKIRFLKMIKDVGKEVYGRIAKDKSRSLLKGYTKDSFYG